MLVSLPPSRPPARPLVVPRESPGGRFQPSLPLDTPDRDPVSEPPLPDALARVARAYSAALVEALTGRRPLGQLAPTMVEEAFARCRELSARCGPALRVSSLRVQRPDAHVLEVSLHLADGSRSYAAALRLERAGGRWRCWGFDVALPVIGATQAA